jgi:hypothetical protein
MDKILQQFGTGAKATTWEERVTVSLCRGC